MPLEVTIDLRGTRRERLTKLRIQQIEKLDDNPEGWRVYEVSLEDTNRGLMSIHVGTLEHRRGAGHIGLVIRALAIAKRHVEDLASGN